MAARRKVGALMPVNLDGMPNDIGVLTYLLKAFTNTFTLGMGRV